MANEHSIKYNQDLLENAKKSKGMGGKRFLGWTPNGAEAWISYNFDRSSKELTIDSNVKLSLLLEDGAILADARVDNKRNATNRADVNDLLRYARKSQTGAVTKTTIKYFIRLKNAVNGKCAPAFVDGLPTKTIFRMVTNSIYAGGTEPSTNDFRWTDAQQVYGLPAGEYFTWEALPNILED